MAKSFGPAAIAMTAMLAPLIAAQPARAAAAPPEIVDFLVQDVCLNDNGNIIVGMIPTDARCKNRRDLTSADRMPYHLTKVVPQNAVDCGARRTIRDNILWQYQGNARVVGAVQIQKDACRTEGFIPAYFSVRWYDDQFAFIMGWWSRGKDGGTVGGGISSQCPKGPHSSVRYFRNWLLTSRTVPANGAIGNAVNQKKSSNIGLSPISGPCPDDYPSKVLALWTRGDFTYSSGKRLNTILSHPYSQVDPSGLTPGKARQMERTYWTREFGQVRWEAWKRDDYTRSRDGKSASEMAESFADVGTCSKPFELKSAVTKGLTLGPVEQINGIYSQVATDVRTGEKHRWIMATCQDMTATIAPQDPKGDPMPAVQGITPRYWDFWR